MKQKQFKHNLEKAKRQRIFEQQQKQNEDVNEWLNNHKKDIESWHKPERVARRQQIENELTQIGIKFNLR